MTEVLDSPERIISADDHMDLHVLPPKLWVDRLPAKYRERAPHVVDTPDGPFWKADGQLMSPSGRKLAGRLDPYQLGYRPSDPKLRLEDLDRDGIYSSVIYGPPRGFQFPDRDVTDACLRAYNDWAAEFNASAPNRLIVLPQLPSHSPQVATEELKRIAGLKHRGAILGLRESKQPVFDPAWEDFWAVANEVEIPIHFHLGGGVHSLHFVRNSWAYPAHVSISPMQLDEMIPAMIFCGVLERYPKVKIVLGEAGLGWIPFVIERMDHEYKKYYDTIKDYRIKEVPSFFWQRQMFTTYEEETFGLEHVDKVGVNNVMWASDYPHGDSTWPKSRQAIMESPLAKLPKAARRAIICDTAAKLYKIA